MKSAEFTFRVESPKRPIEMIHSVIRTLEGSTGYTGMFVAVGSEIRIACLVPDDYDLNAQEGRAADEGLSVSSVEMEPLGGPRH